MGAVAALVTQHALESIPKETLCRVAHSVISPLGPGPVQTPSAQSYTAKAPVTCVHGVAAKRKSPGVKGCPGQRWGRAFVPRRCMQRSASEVCTAGAGANTLWRLSPPRHEGSIMAIAADFLIAEP